MYTSFYIEENRLNELKSFIRTELPTARFKHNPLKEGNKWFIALNMEVEDGNKLNLLHNKWHDEDNPPKSPNKSVWNSIRKAFVIHSVSGNCECGKYAECCRKIHSNSSGKLWIETDEHFICGNVQKQILKIKQWWDNNYH